ncbi:CHAT domain-containing protein [Actinosynnema sp. CA-248983]
MVDDARLVEIRAVRRELDEVVAAIREVPGYRDFLAAPRMSDIADGTGATPLVYLAAARSGGFALVVRGERVTSAEMPGLTAADVRDRVRDHLARYAAYRDDPARGRLGWDTALDDVCAWLWTAAVGPVLAAVGEVDDVVLVAGGLLGLLPLHAAWTPEAAAVTGRRYALDLATFHHVPNARSWQAARRLAAEVGADRLLTVADPWPVAASRLPMADREAAAVAVGFAEHRSLRQGTATAVSFEHAVRQADVVHLACHGVADLDRPLDSGLVLAGGRLTLARMLRLRLRLRLAVLSACETALPGADLPDEVVALSTGLLQAGVAGVVASQWAVPDRASALLMAEFYRGWRRSRQAPAAALRSAARWLRDTDNGEKARHLQQDGWLPPPVAEAFAARLGRSDRRGHTAIHEWGAFTYVGV